MLIDMHTHTTLSSCSRLDVHDMIQKAHHTGLDGICITDHQTMDIRHHIAEGVQSCGLTVIFGMEYETPDGDFLIFGPYETLQPGMDGKTLLTHVQKTGGAAIAAHPFRTGRSVSESIIRHGLCQVVESINGRNSDIDNLKVQKWLKQYPLFQTSGSDAHTPEEVGRYATLFEKPVRTRQDLIFALNAGRFHPGQLGQDLPSIAISS